MNFKCRLDSVDLLASDILNMNPIQRLTTFAAIKTILDEIEAYVDEHETENLDKGNAGIYIAEIYYPLETLVGLDNNGHDEVQNLVWVKTGIDKLRSNHCFDIKE